MRIYTVRSHPEHTRLSSYNFKSAQTHSDFIISVAAVAAVAAETTTTVPDRAPARSIFTYVCLCVFVKKKSPNYLSILYEYKICEQHYIMMRVRAL